MAVAMRDEDREQLSDHEARLVRIEEAVGELRGEIGELRSRMDERFDAFGEQLTRIERVLLKGEE